MSEAEKVEWIAVNVMKWEKEEYERQEHYCCDECGKCTESCKPQREWRWRAKEGHPAYDGNTMGCWFNPLREWKDWRRVEEKVMKDDKAAEAYITSLIREDEHAETITWQPVAAGIIMQRLFLMADADLPTRAKALYLAMQ